MMIGYHSASVISEACLKGVKGFDANKALATCVKTAQLDSYRGIGLYKKLGYVPYDLEGESLSKTMEYAFDDYAIACLAKKLKNTAVNDEFIKRSQNFKHLFNPLTKFMQPKDSKGDFEVKFNPKEYSKHITESNGWQYFWSAPQDINGLISLTGGKIAFEQKLDSMFASAPSNSDSLPIFSTGMIGQYAHGNEPSHHIAYLYDFTNSAHKTQYYCHKIMTDFYMNKPGGLCGNEDCGQMSAWYVFSAMGFYPVDPISLRYQIGTPLVDKAQFTLANNKTFTILAHRQSEKDIYIKSVTLNGKKLNQSYISHSQLMDGGKLVFEMSEKPCPNWFDK
jgi:predicted alpha-1,2-mannosidase